MLMPPEDPRIYVRMLRHVRDQIEKGTLCPGCPTPTITELCRQFTCTRNTAARALSLLADDGLVTRFPGRGYYVTTD